MTRDVKPFEAAAIVRREPKPLPFVDLRATKPDAEALMLIPGDFAVQHQVLPLRVEAGGVLVAAVGDAGALGAVDDLGILVDRPVRAVLADPTLVRMQIEELFIERVLGGLPNEEADAADLDEDAGVADLQQMASETAVVQMVNLIFSQAVRDGASDIHIEPYEREVRVRYRLDGILHVIARPPKRMHAALVSRLKILGEMNIAERRLPQDGRIKLGIAGRTIDVRVAIVPTMYGERAVMRILDKSSSIVDLEAIGMAPDVISTFRKVFRQPHGMVLVTGPTGSGKSTTLYGALTELASVTTNILTIEDPVEYQIFGIGQVQVRPNIGLTFASGLRSFLRQDPDIIMVGEIRDHETAEIAIHAALTGHVVFSTLHTNDAPGAITRLLDMGVEPFLAASSIMAILGQRLLRRNCSNCTEASIEPSSALDALRITPADLQGRTLMRGRGCDLCAGTGFKGRTGIYELLIVDEAVRKMTTDRASASVIKAYATGTMGMRTLLEDGRRVVLAGMTTPEEVLRVCQREEIED